MDFLETKKSHMDINGFWSEEFKSTVMVMTESRYNTEVLKEWRIVDLTLNGDKVLVKWIKRFEPLSDEEVKVKYGR